MYERIDFLLEMDCMKSEQAAKRDLAKRREKYATDPEYRARKVAAQRARRLANPEKFKAARRVSDRARYAANPKKYIDYTAAKRRAYRADPRKAEKFRNQSLKSRYGITSAQFDAMAEEQGGACKICGLIKKLVVDHDHVTGRVRGLLCDKCNRALGGFGDCPAVLKRALLYLGD
ncbi:MAG: endonuclease domain-containing protein [Thermoplasmata archaeon]|nr:endonuclease domain-containing protein [Thermoplasmata archaeon]